MSALMVLENVNRVIGILFLTCYFYQLLYVPVALWRRHRVTGSAPLRRYGVLISARNEEGVIGELIGELFDPSLIAVVQGGRAENQALLDQRFDYIFFTGGTQVGRLVLEKAAVHFTPVTLEMGGKSPCIVDSSANIPLAARRLAFGKFLNAGQTCVAPDYVLVHRSVKEELVSELKKSVTAFFGPEPLNCPDYPKIINEKHLRRLLGLLEGTVAPLILRPALPGHLDILLEEGKGLPVLGMGIQVQSHLRNGEVQSHQLAERLVLHLHLALHGPVEGQVQAGEEGSAGQSLVLAVHVGGVSLHGHEGEDHRGTGAGEGPVIAAAGGGGFVLLQGLFLLTRKVEHCGSAHTILCRPVSICASPGRLGRGPAAKNFLLLEWNFFQMKGDCFHQAEVNRDV